MCVRRMPSAGEIQSSPLLLSASLLPEAVGDGGWGGGCKDKTAFLRQAGGGKTQVCIDPATPPAVGTRRECTEKV